MTLADLPLDDAEREALEAIVLGPLAWSSIADLEAAGIDRLALERLEAEGLAARWEMPPGAAILAREPGWAAFVGALRLGPGVAWTLTPWGASALDVEVRDRGPSGPPFWSPIDAPYEPPRLPTRSRESRLEWPELVVDRAPGPLEVLLDDWTSEPIRLFGMEIPRDRRIKGKRALLIVAPKKSKRAASS